MSVNVPIVSVDLANCFCAEDRILLVKRRLREAGIQNIDSLLLTGVEGTRKRLATIFRQGIAVRESTYAQTFQEMLDLDGEVLCNAIEYAERCEEGVLLIYDSKHLTNQAVPSADDVNWDINKEYRPKVGSSFRQALLAVVKFV